jgi:hypothetical protein
MRNPITRNAALFAASAIVAALFLAGAARAVTDTIFQYSAPKTGYYSLSPGAFSPSSGGTSYGITGGPDTLTDIAGSRECFNSAVNLPQDAKMTAFASWYKSDIAKNITVLLFRSKPADGTSDIVAKLVSTDASGARKPINLVIPQSAIATVDNLNYVYSAFVCFHIGNANNQYYGARISYTYTTAGD